MNDLGWKRVRDKSDDTIRLRWCELKSTINYSAFKEGGHCRLQLSVFAVSLVPICDGVK